jgi:uncharacterized membrane protein
MISNPVAVGALLAGVVWLSVRLEERFALVRSLSAALVAILLSMALSNVGLIPGNSPAYEFLFGPGVMAGIALIMLSVDLRSVISAGPTMLAAFGIGAVGSAVGAIVATLVFGGMVGPEAWKLGGQYTGTYIGGGMNFAALAQAFSMSPDLFTAGTASDVIVTALWMMACLAVPVLLRRPRLDAAAPAPAPADPPAAPAGGEPVVTLERALNNSVRPVPLRDAAALIAITLGALWLSGRLADLVPLPQVLWLTTIALIAAQFPGVKALTGSGLWGNYLMLLFLASNGARSVIRDIFVVGPPVFYFAATTVAVHGLLLFGLGMLFRFDLGTLAVASQANVGGPASAMAMASARGYADRVLPGVAVGLLGYAGGTYVGYVVGIMLHGWLGT